MSIEALVIGASAGGIDALLSDMQTRIAAGGKTTFVHLASKAMTSAATLRNKPAGYRSAISNS